ncbi:MAG TPA: ankyrin repeat domain-containing protein [Sandaracinaceae bacterium LLY-WYZ-13_1]|nr:ankyrin repeat domain-containing protein [Sandaracinaceae bacterium LLY-WYZ-13_1]
MRLVPILEAMEARLREDAPAVLEPLDTGGGADEEAWAAPREAVDGPLPADVEVLLRARGARDGVLLSEAGDYRSLGVEGMRQRLTEMRELARSGAFRKRCDHRRQPADRRAPARARGASEPSAVARAGLRPLYAAVAQGSPALFDLLLEHGADADAEDPVGWTALHLAVLQQEAAWVEALLARGADPERASTRRKEVDGRTFPRGTTPIDCARAVGNEALEERLSAAAGE